MIIARVATFFQNCPRRSQVRAGNREELGRGFLHGSALVAFFVYKAFSGYLISNLSLSL